MKKFGVGVIIFLFVTVLAGAGAWFYLEKKVVATIEKGLQSLPGVKKATYAEISYSPLDKTASVTDLTLELQPNYEGVSSIHFDRFQAVKPNLNPSDYQSPGDEIISLAESFSFSGMKADMKDGDVSIGECSAQKPAIKGEYLKKIVDLDAASLIQVGFWLRAERTFGKKVDYTGVMDDRNVKLVFGEMNSKGDTEKFSAEFQVKDTELVVEDLQFFIALVEGKELESKEEGAAQDDVDDGDLPKPVNYSELVSIKDICLNGIKIRDITKEDAFLNVNLISLEDWRDDSFKKMKIKDVEGVLEAFSFALEEADLEGVEIEDNDDDDPAAPPVYLKFLSSLELKSARFEGADVKSSIGNVYLKNLSLTNSGERFDIRYGEMRVEDAAFKNADGKGGAVKEINSLDFMQKGLIPMNLDLKIKGLEIDASALDSDEARLGLQMLGFNRLKFDLTVDYNFSEEAGEMNLNDYTIKLENGGTLSACAILDNVDISEEMFDEDNADAIMNMKLKKATFSYTDASLVEKLMNMSAFANGSRLDDWKRDLLSNIESEISDVPDSKEKDMFLWAMGEFIDKPDSITFHIEPEKSTPLVLLALQLGMMDPGVLRELNVRVEANSKTFDGSRHGSGLTGTMN